MPTIISRPNSSLSLRMSRVRSLSSHTPAQVCARMSAPFSSPLGGTVLPSTPGSVRPWLVRVSRRSGWRHIHDKGRRTGSLRAKSREASRCHSSCWQWMLFGSRPSLSAIAPNTLSPRSAAAVLHPRLEEIGHVLVDVPGRCAPSGGYAGSSSTGMSPSLVARVRPCEPTMLARADCAEI